MADDAFLDALAVSAVTQDVDRAILDALAVSPVVDYSLQARLNGLTVEVVWTGTGVFTPSIAAEQIDLATGQFEAAGENSRQVVMSDDAVTANKVGFRWRTVEIDASAFQYDGSTTSYYTLPTGPMTTNAPTSEMPELLKNGVDDQTLVTTPSSADEWSITGSILAVYGDVTSSGDVYELTYLTHSSLQDGILLQVSTSDATPAVMTTDGNAAVVSNIIRLEDDSTVLCRIYLVARRTDVDGESAAYILEALFDRNSGAATTAIVGTTRTVFSAFDSSWGVTVSADTTLGGIQVQVTGEGGKSILWRAFVLLQPSQG